MPGGSCPKCVLPQKLRNRPHIHARVRGAGDVGLPARVNLDDLDAQILELRVMLQRVRQHFGEDCIIELLVDVAVLSACRDPLLRSFTNHGGVVARGPDRNHARIERARQRIHPGAPGVVDEAPVKHDRLPRGKHGPGSGHEPQVPVQAFPTVKRSVYDNGAVLVRGQEADAEPFGHVLRDRRLAG